jgi:hypothetical protein
MGSPSTDPERGTTPLNSRKSLVRLALTALSLVLVTGVSAGSRAVSVGGNVNITKQNGNQTEATIALNPTNTSQLFASYNQATSSSGMWRRSTNGGTSWSSAGTGIAASCCDNAAAWDSFGNLFLVNINATVDEIPLYLSANSGSSFTLLQTIDSGNIDQPTVKAGAGAVWVTWNNDGTIYARGAAVTGLGSANIGSFTTAQSAPDSDTNNGQFGDIAIGPSGQVVVVYQNNTTIYANTDPDGLGVLGFLPQVTVTSTNVETFDFIPAQDGRSIDAEANLAYDRSGGAHDGRLYLVYTDEFPDETNNTDIYLRYSDDDGVTWSSRLKVNDDATTTSQFLPYLAVDQTNGDLIVTWHDARIDPTNNNKTRYYGALSTDGGASFGANFQISAGLSNDDKASSGVDYGDYTWVDLYNGLAYPAWADNSNSTSDNPNGNTKFDIYTAKINTNVVAGPVVISSFDPTHGPVGTKVKIIGTGFTGATSVKFNGTNAASFAVKSDTQVNAFVAAGSTTGPISVTAPGGTGTSAQNFKVDKG